MAERREECRRQVGLLPDEFGGLTFSEKLCPLDGDRHDAGDGVQCAEIDGRRNRCEQADGFRAVAQRNDERASVLVTHAHVTAVGPLACVELQRATRLRQRRVQRCRVNADVLAAALVDLPAVIARKTDGHSRQLEAPRHVPGERVDRADGLRGQQHVSRQVEQPRDLVPSRDRVNRTGLRGGRQIARDDGNDQEREERHPVLGIGDGEGADRREEEEVECEHGDDRHDGGDPQPPEGRRGEHDEQQRQRTRGRTHVRQPSKRQSDGSGRQQTPQQDHDVPNPNGTVHVDPSSSVILTLGWRNGTRRSNFLWTLYDFLTRALWYDAERHCHEYQRRSERLIAVVAMAVAGCAGRLETALGQLSEARSLSADLLVQFTKSADAGNRAVMADTDDASKAFAGEADDAMQAVQKDVDALGPILTELRYSTESRLLEEFGKRFAEYRTLTRAFSDWRSRIRISRPSDSRSARARRRPTRSEMRSNP